MAANQPVENDTSDLEMNMTPMIDVVFQLIIFLMLANDLSRKEIEELKLPPAANAQEDKGQGEQHRVIVNLIAGKNGGPPRLKVKGKEYDLRGFTQFITPLALKYKEPEPPNASELFVLIRADKDARWQDVQWVMQVCADPNIKIYKLQFATEDPNKAGKSGSN